MFPAFLTTIFFSVSAVTGHRCAKTFGGLEANFYRLCVASMLLGIYVHVFGQVVSETVAPGFILSGVIGVGVGDLLFFQALPRLGSRLTVLVIQCLSVPVAALIELLWLGTVLHARQIGWITLVLSGLILALLPKSDSFSWRNFRTDKRWLHGFYFAIFAAVGNGFGAVLSRKAYSVARVAGENVEGFSAAYERVLGGLMVALLVLAFARWTEIRAAFKRLGGSENYKLKWRAAWPWVIATSLAGQTFGVTCFQWALKNHPTAVVLPVVALTPLVAIPFTRFFENERPTWKSILGTAIAVFGVVMLLARR